MIWLLVIPWKSLKWKLHNPHFTDISVNYLFGHLYTWDYTLTDWSRKRCSTTQYRPINLGSFVISSSQLINTISKLIPKTCLLLRVYNKYKKAARFFWSQSPQRSHHQHSRSNEAQGGKTLDCQLRIWSFLSQVKPIIFAVFVTKNVLRYSYYQHTDFF